MKKIFLFSFVVVVTSLHQTASGQHDNHPQQSQTSIKGVDPQPLLAQAIRLKDALSFLGSSLSKEDEKRLSDLQHQKLTPEIATQIQNILDPYCLAFININPESRVKVERGPAKARLIQNGWVSYLVKVNNEAGVTAKLEVQSPNAATPLYAPSFDHSVRMTKNYPRGRLLIDFLRCRFTGIHRCFRIFPG